MGSNNMENEIKIIGVKEIDEASEFFDNTHLPKCETCEHWVKDGKPGDGMPYCPELKYWICVDHDIHVPADFGCIRHYNKEILLYLHFGVLVLQSLWL